ncbi:hypothetical protein [Neomegalonema sp.]|uniref:hypothetical protein n=1 Tax=Neomegalonema sp. TaxID=2039713 RepID=UPI0026260DEC|nr:hypothetical protein [Neomegalonema sp.]MDD2867251.1 hypothetical protein [Neomegalonema sp.]
MSGMLKLFLIGLTLSAAILAKAFHGESASVRDSSFATRIERISLAVLEDHGAALRKGRPSLGLRGADLDVAFRLPEKVFASRMEDFGFLCQGAGAARIACRKSLTGDGVRLTLNLTFSGEEGVVVFRHGQAIRIP